MCDNDQVSVASENEAEIEDDSGPGYMGWNSDEGEKIAIKKAFEDIRKDVDTLKTGDMQKTKQILKLEKDVKSLKKEYEQCLLALSKETYERNKAEENNKILKEIIEAEKKEKDKEEKKNRVVNSEEEMSVEEEDDKTWTKPKMFRKFKKNEKKEENCNLCEVKVRTRSDLEEHIKSQHADELKVTCQECKLICATESDLENHRKNQHTHEIIFPCKDCELSYKTMGDLEKHIRSLHVGGNSGQKVESTELRFKCDGCEESFLEEEDLKKHAINAHAEKVFTCQICDKPYPSMHLLRRHDWRSHREIDCNMCGESIRSRQDIKHHRQSKHQMFRKVYCKYYPACIDGDECFFEHDKDENASGGNDGSHCPNGEKCNDQSCNYSELGHTLTVMCKFQAKCNRLNCQYKHMVPRTAFLGATSMKKLRN